MNHTTAKSGLGMMVDKKKEAPPAFRVQKKRSKYPLLLAGLAAIIVVAALLVRIGGKEYSMQEEKQLLKRQLDRYELAEQYALLALEDGWYTCCNCQEVKVYLLRGEVWKYGSTITKNRYSQSLLAGWNVEYQIQFEGDLLVCRKEEITKIRMYKFTPENLKRRIEKRLLRPPGNCKNY